MQKKTKISKVESKVESIEEKEPKMSDFDATYRFMEVVGTSKVSWEDAVKEAVAVAAKTVKDLRIVEVEKLDARIMDQKIAQFRARVKISFKLLEK
jgi:dodecin